jgi:PPOX class probable F420-dependent enzyme
MRSGPSCIVLSITAAYDRLASLRAVETAEALDFIRTHHRAVLATTRADGGVQQSPVAAGVDAEGRVVVSSREPAMKVLNLRRRPYAWLCIFEDGFYGKWMQVEGPTEIISLPAAMDGLMDYYRSISGEHPDWDDYRKAMTEERRVLIALTVERAGPTKAG